MTNNSIRTIIIDDEKEARAVLLNLFKNIPDIEVVAEKSTGSEGLDAILNLNPDLVFIDIQMPGMSGIEVVKKLAELQVKTTVVFVTAYDNYAIQAIKLAAFDFLLKPVDPDELVSVIQKFQAAKMHNVRDSKMDALLKQINHEDRIRLNTRCGFTLVDPAEIIYIQADGNYAEIVFSLSKKELVTLNIGTIEKLMPAGKFIRASRSSLVNIACLRKVDRKARQCELEYKGERHIVHISRDQLGIFDQILV